MGDELDLGSVIGGLGPWTPHLPPVALPIFSRLYRLPLPMPPQCSQEQS